MKNYKEEVKTLLEKNFTSNYNDGKETLYLSTKEVLYLVQGVIPEIIVDEHDIYEVMMELGYEPQLCEEGVLVFKWILFVL